MIGLFRKFQSWAKGHCKATITLWIASILAILISATILMRVDSPRNYTLQDPFSQLERQDLIHELEHSLAYLSSLEDKLSEKTANDPDRLWPKDSTIIVLAINKYILAERSIPRHMNDLFARNYLSPQDTLNSFYVLESDSESWKLRTEAGVSFAYGN